MDSRSSCVGEKSDLPIETRDISQTKRRIISARGMSSELSNTFAWHSSHQNRMRFTANAVLPTDGRAAIT